ncbi:hypothetical protein DF025_20655 [Burkholderia stagnalis]|nr:hypothetical protein DF025_20655 [Burkholderia stagnalis]
MHSCIPAFLHSRIPVSRIPYPVSRIPYPVSRIPYPAFRFPLSAFRFPLSAFHPRSPIPEAVFIAIDGRAA